MWWRGERVDASHNCFRWYQVWVQPDLFGIWTVWTAWGRIGSIRYRQRLRPTDGPSEALQLAQTIIARKMRRGYRVVDEGPTCSVPP